MADTILLPILIPIIAGLIVLAVPDRLRWVKEAIALIAASANLLTTILLFNANMAYIASWAGFGIEFALRLYHFSAFIILAAAAFGFLVILYSMAFLSGKKYAKLFYAYLLITLGFIAGAVLSDHLVSMFFFWEGSLIMLSVLIAIGSKTAFKTAMKAFIILGISDLAMMIGIALFGHLSGTLMISGARIPATGLGGAAFLLLMIGAISKSGSMPFHSWIPDAAIDAPLPFMAVIPAAIEKLLGIYFLTRICLDMFTLEPNSSLSYLLMTIGAITIILAVMMALVQKDYKRLLSYHAISQVGYMILGIGTLVPAGIIGGLFHMLNNAMYKSCLFLTGGAVEKQAGTTDLNKLGGISSKMPITFACYIITALSISGVPPFNGFFSKELVYDGALERGWIFYAAAAIGSFFTAASFLKLGHAAFLKRRGEAVKNVKEAPVVMLVPMVIIALGCILFGVCSYIPINNFIQPVLGAHMSEGHNFSAFPANTMLVVITIIVLIAALLNHIYGVKRSGSGLGAVDHIHYAPVLSTIYDKAQKGLFDPYNMGVWVSNIFSRAAALCDSGIDWTYNIFTVRTADSISGLIRKSHDGNFGSYIIWSLSATVIILIFFLI